jgi:hypothetical protein
MSLGYVACEHFFPHRKLTISMQFLSTERAAWDRRTHETGLQSGFVHAFSSFPSSSSVQLNVG